MLPKRRRLSAQEVGAVLKEGRSVRGSFVQLKYVEKQGFFRISATVPKSLARQAVKRNALRRAMYRSLSPLQVKAKGAWAVALLRAVPPPPVQQALEEEFALLLKKLG